MPRELIDENRPVSRPPILQNETRRWRCSKNIYRHSTHLAPLFYRGAKCPSQILAQISTPVVFEPPYFCAAAVYWKTKTNLSRTDDRSTTTSNLGWVGPPNSQNRWRIWYPKEFTGGSPKRVKLENFLYIIRSNAHAEYTATNVIPPIGTVADVKSLPCHISQFAPYISQGGKK